MAMNTVTKKFPVKMVAYGQTLLFSLNLLHRQGQANVLGSTSSVRKHGRM